MRSVFREAIRLMGEDRPFVVATVVNTKGSTPQKPGSKLLVRKDGSGVGTLGGGCVEGDIWFAAKEIMQNGSGPEFKDYLLNEDIAARDGLVCGGSMYFFIQPIGELQPSPKYFKEIVAAYEGAPPVALATVVKSRLPNASLGTTLFVRTDGTTLGGLGSDELDQQAIAIAQRLMPMGQNQYVATESGIDLFIEGYTAPPTLILMGGGHVSRAIGPLAQHLGYRLYVMDDRPEFANLERFPMATDVAVTTYGEGLTPFPVTANTAIVIATRGHQFDDWALEEAARSPAGYVGLIGSKRKTLLIYEALISRGVPSKRLKAIHAPIGLDIGARTPEEIAISVISEIVQFYMGGTGGPMKLEEQQIEKLVRKAHRNVRQSVPID